MNIASRGRRQKIGRICVLKHFTGLISSKLLKSITKDFKQIRMVELIAPLLDKFLAKYSAGPVVQREVSSEGAVLEDKTVVSESGSVVLFSESRSNKRHHFYSNN